MMKKLYYDLALSTTALTLFIVSLLPYLTVPGRIILMFSAALTTFGIGASVNLPLARITSYVGMAVSLLRFTIAYSSFSGSAHTLVLNTLYATFSFGLFALFLGFSTKRRYMPFLEAALLKMCILPTATLVNVFWWRDFIYTFGIEGFLSVNVTGLLAIFFGIYGIMSITLGIYTRSTLQQFLGYGMGVAALTKGWHLEPASLRYPAIFIMLVLYATLPWKIRSHKKSRAAH